MEFIKKNLFKIIIAIIFVGWVSLILFDFFRARNMVKPLICLSESTEEYLGGTYYQCTSLGYVYFVYTKKDDTKDYGFRAIFSKDPVKAQYGENK